MFENIILIIDSDLDRVNALEIILQFIGCNFVSISDGKSWQAPLNERQPVHAVLIGRPGAGTAESIVNDIHEVDPNAPIFLLMEGEQKPGNFTDKTQEIIGFIEVPIKHGNLTNALQKAKVYRESREDKTKQRPVELFRSLTGNSRKIQQVRDLVEQVADSDATVLILGESGTGKEVVARNIHYYSSRRSKPFVPINCGAIPPDLLESELFGHEKGAFTGAICARQGRFEMAEGGTLFLDEIGDMPLAMQVKLLRVLQERSFERIGSSKSISTNVRIIAATHRNLEEFIKDGKFREDLYYRLNVFPIEMPPLKGRIEDIPLLITELISRIEHEKRGSVRLTQAAVMTLCQYPWQGNVRELANLIERLVILYPFGVVDASELPEKFRASVGTLPATSSGVLPEFKEPLAVDAVSSEMSVVVSDARLPREGINLKEHLNELEINLIRQALDEADGVVAHAAKLLNMRRTTLVEKLRKYGLQRAVDTS